jgi:transposase
VPELEQDKDALIAQLKAENELLREKIDLLIRKIYGASSEKLDADQLELLLNPDAAKKPGAAGGDEDAPAAEAKQGGEGGKRRSRPRLPEDIEVIEEIIDHEEVDPDDPSWYHLDEEVSERLEYEQARFWLRRIIRRTWVKRGDADRPPLTAPLPPCLLEGSLLTPSLAAHLITSKFTDHLPFYRQEQILDLRHDIGIGRNTMCHWAGVCATWLEPLYNLMAAELRRQDWLGADETPIDYLSPGHGKTKQGYLWTYRHPEIGVLYDWHTGRSHHCLDRVLTNPLTGEDFRGILLTDGYAAYGTWQRKHEGITLAACWAHVRRKFHEAAEHHPEEALPILLRIAELFRIETCLRNQRAGPKCIREVRRAQCRRSPQTVPLMVT